jgi:gluconokinase
MESYVIGIDIGTGSTKAIAMNHAGVVLDTTQVSYPTLQPQPGYHEQAPELIWQAFAKCISGITGNRKKNPDAVCLSSVMHSLIPVDDNHQPLMNMMIWTDNRSASVATRIHESAAGQLLYEKSGTPIHAMSPLCKIIWLKEHQNRLFTAAKKFISIKEYIWYKLFGTYEVDYSIASATGLFNIADLAWNDLSLDVTSLDAGKLSTPVDANYNRKCTDPAICRLLGITTGTAFLIGASDGCLANIGSFATEEGSMALTIGTSGAVRVMKKYPMLNFKAMTFNYRLDGTNYICGGPTNNGGGVLKWYAETFLANKLETARDYDVLLEGLDISPPGAEGVIFLPYVFGERAPIWSSEVSGAFFGMRGYHRQHHFIRAVVEGISIALYDIAQTMIDTGLDIRHIHVSGGFVHSAAWLQTLADIFGKKVCLINTADASASGAALLAMKHLGVITDYTLLMPKEITKYLPQPEHMDTYRELFLRYKSLYNSVAGFMGGTKTKL